MNSSWLQTVAVVSALVLTAAGTLVATPLWIGEDQVKYARYLVVATVLLAAVTTSIPAFAAWCVWPGRPHIPPHPCRYGGVPVAPAYGRWDGDNWEWSPGWAPVPPGVVIVPNWWHHDWDHTRDWR